jgi:hypothetical protein
MNTLDEKLTDFGKAITQCADLLSTLITLGGEEAYFEKTPPKFSTLANLDIVLGNVSDGYSASSLLMELSRSLVRQETTKRLAPDVDEWIEHIYLRIDQLNNALADNNNDSYALRLSQIRELVLVMREGLINEMRNIEFSINTKFGHVESIQDKQAENKYLISRVSRLTDKLMLLDFKKLRSMSGENSDLLTLLPNRLHDTIEQCRLSLINSLPRLKHLLWEFEKTNKNAQLVWALHHHLRNQSVAYSHTPSDSELETLELCSQQGISKIEVLPSICDDSYTDDIISIVHSMKPRNTESVLLPEVVDEPSYFNESVEDDSAALDDYMETKLLYMVSLAKDQKVSCLSFWKENLSEQSYPSGFLQWAHKMLKNEPSIKLNLIQEEQSALSGNEHIIDFTIEIN